MVLKEQVSLGPGGWVWTTDGTWLGDEQGDQRRTVQCAWKQQGGVQTQGCLTCQGCVSGARLGATPRPPAYRLGHRLCLRTLSLLLVIQQV